ncbi:MAG: DNA-processing protein DprA [Patescibacteria group bacterium]|nr:DNA-processing protein DprA [Patescibacteria group bacterium]
MYQYDILIVVSMLHKTLNLKDEGYPRLLAEIPGPPERIHIKGKLPVGFPTVAIVGTRKATMEGKRLAGEFAAGLSKAGCVIVSGLALGIDSAAHEGALASGALTVAVLGNSIDSIYPEENQSLANRIVRQGAVISEYGPGASIQKSNFLERNRIISGLSLAVLVIEAPEHSGALATARHAGEQGRDIFVVPGNVGHPNYVGSHQLIRDGAILVRSVEDVLEDLRLT